VYVIPHNTIIYLYHFLYILYIIYLSRDINAVAGMIVEVVKKMDVKHTLSQMTLEEKAAIVSGLDFSLQCHLDNFHIHMVGFPKKGV
jgi:hypothetical protein